MSLCAYKKCSTVEAYPDFGEGDQIHEGHHPTNDGLGSSRTTRHFIIYSQEIHAP